MRRQWGLAGAAVALLLSAGPALAEPVDVAIVLAADVSGSITEDEFNLQRQGYAQAIASTQVIAAIQGGEKGAVRLCYVEWAGLGEQQVVVDWTTIRDLAGAKAFAATLDSAPRSFLGRTAIGSAIDFAVQRLGQSEAQTDRHVIDVSGDGTSNSGRDVQEARADAVKAGVTINGLAIINNRPAGAPNGFGGNYGYGYLYEHTHPQGGLPNYYYQNVVGGPGMFVLQVEDFNSFAQAMVQKLVNEIASATPTGPVRRKG